MGNNYVILNLKEGATITEIKARFRVLCKEYHPDKTGNDKIKTAKFILIKDAYDALLKGDEGISNTKQQYYNKYTSGGNTKTKQTYKKATYKFITIKKDSEGYIIKFDVYGVNTIFLYGKNDIELGSYNVINNEGRVHLRVTFADAKKANYVFKCKLYDNNYNYAISTWKVKSPTFLEKCINWLKNI